MKKSRNPLLSRLLALSLALSCTVPVAWADNEIPASDTTNDTSNADAVNDATSDSNDAASPSNSDNNVAAVTDDINVKPIPGLSADFIKGMDISTILAEEASGVKYYNEDGKEEDLLKILADNGINYIRVRVWNNPYDANGNGYGGGNNDVTKAAEIGRRAAAYGLKLLVDFHYSDFWADPAKQKAPKAWANMTVEQKANAVYAFTLESLNTIREAGANVGMVQVGNETNGGICGVASEWKDGVEDWTDMAKIFTAGSKAVRAFDPNVLVALHFTNPEDPERYPRYAKLLQENQVDYDVFASSYYPNSHGSIENLGTVLGKVATDYGKKMLVVENSYDYTTADSDGISSDTNPETWYNADMVWNFSVQGLANEVRDVMNVVHNIPNGLGLGYFYWEGAWITVGNTLGLTGETLEKQMAANSEKWEKHGSGWASSYSAEYDPDDAGKWYGGSNWDNKAFFDPSGKMMPSLKVFRYVNTGSVNPNVTVDRIRNPILEATVGIDKKVPFPQTVVVDYNNGEQKRILVNWDKSEVEKDFANETAGEYIVKGTLEDGTAVRCNVTIHGRNYIPNPGFEEQGKGWTLTDRNYCTAFNDDGARSGNYGLHFWWGAPFGFTIEQTVTNIPAGRYDLGVFIQGQAGNNAQPVSGKLWYEIDDKRVEIESPALAGFKNFQNPNAKNVLITGGEIKVGFTLVGNSEMWGTLDDFYLTKSATPASESASTSAPSGSNLDAAAGASADESATTTPASSQHLCAAYTDLPDGEAKDSICCVIENGWMVGTSATTFEPEKKMNRAMVLTTLYNLAGKPETTGDAPFSDVVNSAFYAEPVAWACQAGLLDRTAATFRPYEEVTGQQVLNFLFAYVKQFHPEKQTFPSEKWTSYADANPEDNVTRAEYAKALQTFFGS